MFFQILSVDTDLLIWFQTVSNRLKSYNRKYLKTTAKSNCYLIHPLFLDINFYETTNIQDWADISICSYKVYCFLFIDQFFIIFNIVYILYILFVRKILFHYVIYWNRIFAMKCINKQKTIRRLQRQTPIVKLWIRPSALCYPTRSLFVVLVFQLWSTNENTLNLRCEHVVRI